MIRDDMSDMNLHVLLWLFTSIENPVIFIILFWVSTCLSTETFPQKFLFLYFYDISYPCAFGHSLVEYNIIYLAAKFWYELTCTIMVFKPVHLSYFVIFNHQALCDWVPIWRAHIYISCSTIFVLRHIKPTDIVRFF